MSRRNKLRKGNPSPQKSQTWLEARVKETTPARRLLEVDHEGMKFPIYPVNKRLRKFVDQNVR